MARLPQCRVKLVYYFEGQRRPADPDPDPDALGISRDI